MNETIGRYPKFGIIMLCLLVTSIWTVESSTGRDNYADLGNRNDEQYHGLSGWGEIRGEELEGAKDPTSRYQLLGGLNSVDLFVPQAGIPYKLTTRTLDGGCDDSFKIYVNDKGPFYTYYAIPGDRDIYPFHEVEIDAGNITGKTVKVTFENIATDDCGLAAVYFVELEESVRDRPSSPPLSVDLYAEKTDVEVGEKISLILSAVSLITDQKITVQLILKNLSGMSVTGTGIIDSGGGQYIRYVQIGPGEQKDVSINIETNQVGTFTVVGEIYYRLEDEPRLKKYKTKKLPLVVRNTVPTTTAPVVTIQKPETPEKNGEKGEEGGVCGPTALLGIALLPLGLLSVLRRRS